MSADGMSDIRAAGWWSVERARPTERAVIGAPKRGRRPVDPMAAARPIVHDRSKGMCERCCAERATDMYPRQLRRHGDHQPANLADLCRTCHNWAHGNPAQARKAGFIVSGSVDPRTVPLEHGLYGRVRLDDKGGWELAA